MVKATSPTPTPTPSSSDPAPVKSELGPRTRMRFKSDKEKREHFRFEHALKFVRQLSTNSKYEKMREIVMGDYYFPLPDNVPSKSPAKVRSKSKSKDDLDDFQPAALSFLLPTKSRGRWTKTSVPAYAVPKLTSNYDYVKKVRVVRPLPVMMRMELAQEMITKGCYTDEEVAGIAIADDRLGCHIDPKTQEARQEDEDETITRYIQEVDDVIKSCIRRVLNRMSQGNREIQEDFEKILGKGVEKKV